jgi:hypothetical protein
MLKRFLVVLVIVGLAVIPSATGAEKSAAKPYQGVLEPKRTPYPQEAK